MYPLASTRISLTRITVPAATLFRQPSDSSQLSSDRSELFSRSDRLISRIQGDSSQKRVFYSSLQRLSGVRSVLLETPKNVAMKYNKLGSSDILVSEVCMGTMTFGQQNSEEESHELLDYCLARGVNFFDVAEIYSVPMREETAGRSEEFLGTWLKKQQRDKLIVATKVAGYMPNSYIPGNRREPRSNERQDCRLDRESIRAACEGSLRRLQTDYIDLYQIHWPDRYVAIFGKTAHDPKQERPSPVPIKETVAAMGELIKEGKIRAYGLSNETTFGVCQFCQAADELGLPRPISIQNSFSLVHRSFETELAEACAPSNYNIGLLPWSPLAGGVLSGKYAGGKRPAKARFTLFDMYQERYTSPAVTQAVDKYMAIAQGAGITPSQLALAWCKSRWYVSSTIIGATTMEQLKENLDGFEIELAEETLKAIDQVHLEQKDPAMLL